MGWKILIGGTEYTQAVLEKIEEILNGHIEAAFTIPNTIENRTLANSDNTVEIFYNDTSEFKGTMRAPEFQHDKLLCTCYQTGEEQGQRKVHTGTHTAVNPDTILAAICASGGIVAGICPSTPAMSVRYDKTYCYYAARYVAWVLGKELYHDFSGANPRYNIGTAGTGYPTGRGLLQYTTVPRRKKDRAKKRDKVYLRGLDLNGLPIVGEAGTGTEVYVGFDRNSTDQTTIDAMAAKKLAELNTESAGCVVPVALESLDATPAYVQGYDIHAGDYVIMNCPELDYASAVVRVAKVTKRLVDIEVEIEKAEKLMNDYLDESMQWEDLGIYTFTTTSIASSWIAVKEGSDTVVYDQRAVEKQRNTNSRIAINAAIADASCNGLTLTAETYDFDQALVAKTGGFTLWVQRGAIIRATTLMDRLIDGRECSDVAIKGEGTVDGTDKAKYVIDTSAAVSRAADWIIGPLLVTGRRDTTNSCLVFMDNTEEIDFQLTSLDGDEADKPNGIHYCIIMNQSNGKATVNAKRLSRYKIAAIRFGGAMMTVNESAFATPLTSTGTANVEVCAQTNSAILMFNHAWFECADAMTGASEGNAILITEGTYPLRMLTLKDCNMSSDKTLIKSTTTVNHLAELDIEGGRMWQGGADPYCVDCNVTSLASIKPRERNLPVNASKIAAFKATHSQGTVFPTSKIDVGDTFYRTDLNETYRYDGSDWYLLIGNAPEEGQVPNGSFAYPRDMTKNVAYWTKCAREGNIANITFARETGASNVVDGTGVAITNTAADRGAMYSDQFPVEPNKLYLFSCYIKRVGGVVGDSAHLYSLEADTIGGSETPYDLCSSNATTLTRIYKVQRTGATTRYMRMEVTGDKYAGVKYYFSRVRAVEISDTNASSFPSNPYDGQVCFREDMLQSFRYYSSPGTLPNISGWVPMTRVCHEGTTAQRLAATVITGDFWFDTDQQAMYQWNGASWIYIGSPLTPRSGSVGGENLVLNPAFEEDFNADGVPDHWATAIEAGAPTFGRSASQQIRGGYTVYITAGSGKKGRWDSDKFPVHPGLKLYVEGWRLGSGSGSTTYPVIDIRWYQKDKTTVISETNWSQTSINATWTKVGGEATAPANAYYAKICVLNIEFAGTIYFDDIKCSEQRAAAATDRVVNDSIFTVPATVSIPSGTYTTVVAILDSFLTEDCDFCMVWCQFKNPGGIPQWAFRVYDNDASLASNRVVWDPQSTSDSVVLVFMLPWNVKSHVLYIQAYQNSGSSYNITGGPYSWGGAAPHVHR